MKIAICDYKGPHLFPPIGYGGIERWLYACALGGKLCNYSVTLIGDRWQDRVKSNFSVIEDRIESDKFEHAKHKKHKFDMVICGHEYFDDPIWSEKTTEIAKKVVTFQHGLYKYNLPKLYSDCFYIHCYSDEMRNIYSAYNPKKSLASGEGLDEQSFLNKPKNYLLWLGRIDEEKAPHLAIHSMQKLKGYDLIIAGPILNRKYYNEKIAPFLKQKNIKYIGEVTGLKKSALIASSKAFFYTKAKDYVEPGALIFSEVLKFGVPILAVSWQGKDCSVEAICENTGYCVVGNFNLDQLTDIMAEKVQQLFILDRAEISRIGRDRFCLKKQINSYLFD